MPVFYIIIPNALQPMGFQIFRARGRPEAFEMLKRWRETVPGAFAMQREQLEHFFYGNAVLRLEETEDKPKQKGLIH